MGLTRKQKKLFPRRRPKVQPMAPLWVRLLACALVFAVVGIFGGKTVYNIVRHLDAQARYQQTAGMILGSEVKITPDEDGKSYDGAITYRYTVDGRQFTSDRDYFKAISISDKNYAAKRVASNPLETTVTVYYDPRDPSQSVLQLEIPSFNFVGLLFLQVFAFMLIPLVRSLFSGDMGEATPRFIGVASYLVACAFAAVVFGAEGVANIKNTWILWAWLGSIGVGVIAYGVKNYLDAAAQRK